MSALGRVLGRGEVAQSRMAVPAVVLVLEIADTRASSKVVQWLRLRHSFMSRWLNDSM
jgi:hypothetical protein